MASITTRAAKGIPLTHAEVDANFTNLNADKAETAAPTFTGEVKIAAGTAAAPSVVFTGDVNTGLYSPGSDQLAISTGGAQRATVDSAGRFLMGTSTARGNFFNTTAQETVFQIEGTTNNNSRASFTRNSADDNSSLLLFGKTRSASVGGNTVVQNNDSLGGFSFLGSDGTELVQAANIVAFVDGTPGADDMPGRLVFSTTADGAASPTERMRITSAGRLCVGTTTAGTASGDGVVALGAGLLVIGNTGTAVASTGTVDIDVSTSGEGYQGLLVVSNSQSTNATVRSHSTYSVFGRGTASSIQQIATTTANGGRTFTVTTPSNGKIRVTNTSDSNCTVFIQFFGGLAA